jgi:hypothetical protein
MPMVAPTFVRIATVAELQAELWQKIGGSGEPVFTSMDVLLFGLLL